MKPKRDTKLDTPIACLASIVASIVLVLSLVPIQGLAEAFGEAMEPAPAATQEDPANGSDAGSQAGQEDQAPSGPAEGPSADQPTAQGNEEGGQAASPANPQQGEAGGTSQPSSDPVPEPAEEPNRNVSANLADFLTKSEILDTEDKDGTTTVDEGTTYKVRLSFEEGAADKEFAEEGELTFKLPEGFSAADEQPAAKEAFTVSYSDGNGEHPIEMAKDSWWVDGDTIHLAWRVRDAENRSKEEVDEALKTLFALDNVEFDIDVAGTFAKDATEVDFGAGAIKLKVNPAKKDDADDQDEDDEEDDDEDEEEEDLEDPDAIANEYVYEDDQVLVTATTTSANKIPADATLVVSRVDGQSSSLYLSALNASASNVSEYDQSNTLLYDVSFDWYGEEVQPAEGDVKVSFAFKQGQLSNEIGAQERGYVEVNHVPMTDGVPTVEPVGASVSVDDETASFSATGFSVYTFSYTVDFTFNGYTYAMPGQGDVKLSSLFVALGINRNVADVASVTFTDPQLLSVTKELVGSDWRLVSLKPFATFETLHVVMTNGDVYEISVMDSSTEDKGVSTQAVGVTRLGKLKLFLRLAGRVIPRERLVRITIIIRNSSGEEVARKTLDEFTSEEDGEDPSVTIGDLPVDDYTITGSGSTEDESGEEMTVAPVEAKATVTEGNTTEVTLTGVLTGKAILQVAKEVVGGNYKGNEKFAFKLEKTSYSTSQTDVLPENTTINVQARATGQFGNISYSEAGTYIYTITEVKPEKPTSGMTYDTEPKYAIVSVDSDLKAKVYYVSTWNFSSYENLSPEERASKIVEDLTAGKLFEVIPDGKLKVTNTFFEDEKTPQLTVRKVVVSTRSEDKARSYGFKVTLSNKKITGTYGEMTFKNGVATFTLKNGEDKRATGLPLGSNSKLSYEVVETDSGGLTAKMGKPIKSSSGNAQYVTCTNTYKRHSSRLERQSSLSSRGTLTRSSARSSLARTRDDTNTVVPIVLLAIGAVGVVGGVIYRRRKQQ